MLKVHIEFELPYFGEIAAVLESVPRKVSAQLSRRPALCKAPEADDQLRDIYGNVCGSVEVKRV